MMTELRPIALTPLRRKALLEVKRGAVQYRVASADFVVDGIPMGGWDRRTYSEVHRAGLITYPDGRGDRTVRLTKHGREALELLENDTETSPEDSPQGS